jgi:hypothetical protein
MRLVSIAVAIALFGCGEKEGSEGGGSGAAARGSHECKITVAPAGDPRKIIGSGPTEEEAWEAACAELPEGERDGCKDPDRWSSVMGTMTMNGEETKTVNLTERKPENDAVATSSESSEDACQKARLEACKAAGADGDCVESGDFEERGRRASSTSM